MRHVPTTLQVAQTECGLCVARSILAFHGHDVPTTALRQVLEPGRDGLSLRQIDALLRQHHMTTRMLRVKALEGLKLVDAPFIAHWKGYHFVVVERVSERSAVIMDPMLGRREITRAEFVEDFSGLILTAEPDPEFVRVRRPAFAAWRGKPIWPHGIGGQYAGLVALSLAVFGFTLAVPILTQHLVDLVTSGDIGLGRSLAAITGLAVAYAAVLILRIRVMTSVVRAVSWQLLTGAFARLIRLPLKYFMSRPPGELMYRINSLNQVQELIATRIVQGLMDLLSVLVLTGYVFWTSTLLGGTVVALTLVIVGLLLIAQRVVKSATDQEVHDSGRAQSIQMDAVVSITSLRIGGYADSYLDDWRGAYRSALNAMMRRVRIQQGWLGSTVTAVQTLAPVAILIASLSWVAAGTITLGQAVAVQGVSALLFGLSTSVFQSWTDGIVASQYLERADDIYSYPTEPLGGSRTTVAEHSIDLRNVSFRYADYGAPVLSDITMSIPAGAVVALVGESGSGKTTLGKVLASLYPASTGEVRFGGRSIQDYRLESLRSEIGYIPQEGYLHNRTLLENLTLGTAADEDQALALCRTLPFLDFIDAMPMGYHTVVSEMGANFSGGQRQRIAIAKALIRSPRILVMDEATSALDNANQRLVHDCIAALDCTQVIIAHRLSTVLAADQIYVMSGGRIEQVGTHAELVGAEGAYARLFATPEGEGATRG